jgi:uncharacterized membrane protein
MTIALAFLIGLVAGLRTMTAPAVLAWAAKFGWLPVGGTWAAFMGYWFVPLIFTALAIVEFVADQLPATPSRKTPMQFGARLVSGAFCGAIVGTAAGAAIPGLVAGVLGAVAGTIGGYAARVGLVRANGGTDRPIALLEDAVAVVLGLAVAAAA